MSSDDRRARRGRSRSRSKSPPRHHRHQSDRHRRSRPRSSPDRRRHRDRSYSPRDRRSRPRSEDHRHRSSYEDRHRGRERRHERGSEGRYGYQEALTTGLDQGLDTEPYPTEERKRRRSPERRRSREERRSDCDHLVPPSQFICIAGLPKEAEEEDLQALFAPIPGIKCLMLNKAEKGEESSETCNGTAMLEMISVPAAVAVMESEWREGAYFKEHRLRLEYSRPPPPSKGIKGITDWICGVCKFVNFAKRMECRQCTAPRTAECKPFCREEPSHVLRISNLEPQIDEKALEFMLKPHAPLKFVRLARDKVTDESRFVAFAYFYSIKDATAVRKALEDMQQTGQSSKLVIAYATDRRGVAEEELENLKSGGLNGEGVPSSSKERRRRRESNPRSKAENALEGAGWEPKAFDEAAVEVEEGQKGAGAGQTDFNFEFDAATGYMKDSASGYLYDVNTGFYFHPTLQQWGHRNAVTGEFVPYDAQHAQQQGGASTAAESAVAAMNVSIASKKAASVAVVAAEATAPAKQRQSGPVIGAAPRLNPEALRIATEEKLKAQQEQQANAPVQGVIHRGTWARRKAAQQQQ